MYILYGKYTNPNDTIRKSWWHNTVFFRDVIKRKFADFICTFCNIESAWLGERLPCEVPIRLVLHLLFTLVLSVDHMVSFQFSKTLRVKNDYWQHFDWRDKLGTVLFWLLVLSLIFPNWSNGTWSLCSWLKNGKADDVRCWGRILQTWSVLFVRSTANSPCHSALHYASINSIKDLKFLKM